MTSAVGVWSYARLAELRRQVALLREQVGLDDGGEQLAEAARLHAAAQNLGVDAGYDPTYDPAHDPHLDFGPEEGV